MHIGKKVTREAKEIWWLASKQGKTRQDGGSRNEEGGHEEDIDRS
jgi:hypothetical protein